MGTQSAREVGGTAQGETAPSSGGGRGYGVRHLARGERASLVVLGPEGLLIGRTKAPRLVEVSALQAEVPHAASALAAAQEAADLFAQASLSDATWANYRSHWADWQAWYNG